MFTPFCCRFADRTCVVFPAPVVLLLWREGRHSLFGFLAQKISRMHLAEVLYARALFQPKVHFSARKLNRMTCTHPNTSRSLTNHCQHPSMLSLHRGRLAWRRNKSAPCNRTCNSVSNSWLHSIIRTCFTMSYSWSTHPLVASVQTSTKAPNKTWHICEIIHFSMRQKLSWRRLKITIIFTGPISLYSWSLLSRRPRRHTSLKPSCAQADHLELSESRFRKFEKVELQNLHQALLESNALACQQASPNCRKLHKSGICRFNTGVGPVY